MTNKYLEKIASFPRLSEASFKNLTQEERQKVHKYITEDADKNRVRHVLSGAAAGAVGGGLIGHVLGKSKAATILGTGIGTLYGTHKGVKSADSAKASRVDTALGNANLASVLRQPMN